MDSGFLGLLGVMVSIGMAGAICIGAVFVFKALASRIELRGGGPDDLERIKARLAELEATQGAGGDPAETDSRLAELEERVDFAERMLLKSERRPEQLS